MKTHTIEQSVRYVETDRMQVVHHSTYLYWYEVGRTSLLAAAGFPYHELEASGTRFPVIEYSCRLTGSSDYGDTVRIETSVSTLRSREVVFAYHTYNRGHLIATGMTRHIAVDLGNRPRRLSQELLDALRPYVEFKTESRNR